MLLYNSNELIDVALFLTIPNFVLLGKFTPIMRNISKEFYLLIVRV